MVFELSIKNATIGTHGCASDVINHGCMRQLPEVIDGHAPHTQRGCGAQAWGVTELYRVVKQLKKPR